MSIILLPEGADESLLESIMMDVHEACCDLEISLIGGHTESVPGLGKPIVSGFMMGELSKEDYVTTGGAKPGDAVIMTKGAGIEGTGVLASDLTDVLRQNMSRQVLRDAVELLKEISVVREALLAMEIGGIHSLHTPTEGGVLNGIWEMTEAADVGVTINESSIPLRRETKAICKLLGVDPLKLLGSGALLIVMEAEKVEEMVSAFEDAGVEASVIGKILPVGEGRILVKEDGAQVAIEAIDQDEVYRLLEKYS